MPDLIHSDGRLLLHVLDVDPPVPQAEPWEHGVIWRGVNRLVIALGEAHWYGQGALAHQLWPLEKTAQYRTPFITSDNGVTGLLGIQEPFWFTSGGAGVWVADDSLITSFNAPLQGQPPAHSFNAPAPLNERPQRADDVPTDHALTIEGENLTVRFFACENALAVVEAYWKLISVSSPPPDEFIAKPLWTTWAQFKTDISQEIVLRFAREIGRHGFGCALLGIDARWQPVMGDSHFNPAIFPDPQAMADAAQALGIKLTLWTAPYIEEASENFKPGAEGGYFITDAQGQPFIGPWWGGQAAFVDPSRAESMGWYMGNFRRDAVDRYGLHGLKIDGGEAMFYAQEGMAIPGGQAINRLNQLYVRHAARHFPWSDTRSGWRNQAEPMLFRQWDKASQWGFDNGLASCLAQAMMLNLLGYPYSFPDMIGGNLYGEQIMTAELMSRWTQAVAPMPIIQFSVAPWDYGEECTALCARYARLHEELAGRNSALARQRVPIVRPLWWLAPEDEAALSCADEYLIGDDLLVAPVIQEGARSRAIYLPPGTWRSYWDHAEVHQGASWLGDYPAPLDVLPLFERVAT